MVSQQRQISVRETLKLLGAWILPCPSRLYKMKGQGTISMLTFSFCPWLSSKPSSALHRGRCKGGGTSSGSKPSLHILVARRLSSKQPGLS